MGQLTTKEDKTRNVKALLMSDAMRKQVAMAAPAHIPAEKILRVALTSIQRAPKLLECTQESLLGCILECSALGLVPDSVAQMAHLIPYGAKCTLVVGYRGLRELARRSGELKGTPQTRCVYAKDVFDYCYGLEQKLVHIPSKDIDHGLLIAAYAMAWFKDDGPPAFEVMSKAQIDAIKSRSPASKGGPWVTDYDEMARKTALKRLCKSLPSSSDELQRAVTLDDRADRGIPQDIDFIDVTATASEEAPPAAPQTVGELAPVPRPADPAPKKAAAKKTPTDTRLLIATITGYRKTLGDNEVERAMASHGVPILDTADIVPLNLIRDDLEKIVPPEKPKDKRKPAPGYPEDLKLHS